MTIPRARSPQHHGPAQPHLGHQLQRPHHRGLIPLALRGVRYTLVSAHDLLRRNLTLYGLGGLVLPFLGIKLIDLIVFTIPGIG